MTPLRITSPLSQEVEDLVERTIGACMTVHSALGPGLLESIYSRAIAAELSVLNIAFELERSFPVTYRGAAIGQHRIDLLIEGKLVLESEGCRAITTGPYGPGTQLSQSYA